MIGRDWTHVGVAKLYTDIVNNGYHILYLTSRSVGQADTTRAYLNGVGQDGYRLPRGPVIMSPDRTMAALRREVYLRKPEVFKMGCLRDIMNLFQSSAAEATPSSSHGGDSLQRTPFYAGFGNRLTDALSYRSVAIPPTRIFTINSNAEVSLHLLTLIHYRTSYVSIWELVDHYFPPVGLLIKEGGEEYTDFNYWRDKPLDLVDFSASESEDEEEGVDEDEDEMDEDEIDEEINGYDDETRPSFDDAGTEYMEASFMSRDSLEDAEFDDDRPFPMLSTPSSHPFGDAMEQDRSEESAVEGAKRRPAAQDAEQALEDDASYPHPLSKSMPQHHRRNSFNQSDRSHPPPLHPSDPHHRPAHSSHKHSSYRDQDRDALADANEGSVGNGKKRDPDNGNADDDDNNDEDSFLVEESRQLDALNLAVDEEQDDQSQPLARFESAPNRPIGASRVGGPRRGRGSRDDDGDEAVDNEGADDDDGDDDDGDDKDAAVNAHHP